MSKDLIKECSDLGVAAFLRLHAFKVLGRKGKKIYFSVPFEQLEEFQQLSVDFISSEYHEYDMALMALKKLPDFMPKDSLY